MNISLVKRWIKALRSGKYKQGCQFLRTLNNEYCCLGVLCDIVDKSAWIRCGDFYVHQNNLSTLLPNDIAKKVGMNDRTEIILIKMNDKRHFSFNSIANYLERKFRLQ